MKNYPSDLTDTHWQLIEKMFDAQERRRKRKHSLRAVLDAIWYVVKGGIQWRMLPKDFPKWQTVYWYYQKWRKNGFWALLHDTVSKLVRRKAGKQASPSIGIFDSQSVKTTAAAGQRGYDMAKCVKGRKRHIVVDTLGLILAVIVHRADIDERRGAKFLLRRLAYHVFEFRRLQVFFADQGYGGDKMKEWVRRTFRPLGWRLQIVKKIHPKEFEVLPKRWIVERTFGWFNNYRRLDKDYEYYPKNSETIIQLAMIQLMLNKLD